MAETGSVKELVKHFEGIRHYYSPEGWSASYPAVHDSPSFNDATRKRIREEQELLSGKRRRMMSGPFVVPSPSGGMPYDVDALWKEINDREVAARKSRRNARSLDAYQRAFFAVFPHYLPYHVGGYPIRLTYEERELWNRVKPASRKPFVRRYKPRRRVFRRRRAPMRRRGTYRKARRV